MLLKDDNYVRSLITNKALFDFLFAFYRIISFKKLLFSTERRFEREGRSFSETRQERQDEESERKIQRPGTN
jgi:hypothetical protein